MKNAEEIISRLIDERKITGEEALTLLKALDNEKTIERYVYRDNYGYPYTIWYNYPWYSISNTSYDTKSTNNNNANKN